MSDKAQIFTELQSYIVEQLGVDSYSLSWSSMTRRWHVDPEWYEQTGDVYSPLYRPFVGMPRVP